MISHDLRRGSALVSIAALVAGLSAGSAGATVGYFANGYGGVSKGMAGAGVAMPGGVLGMAQNPATGNAVGKQAGLCLTAFSPIRKFSIGGAGPLTTGTQESRNELFAIPCGGFNYRLDERSTIGIFAFGNGGMNSEYAVNPFAGLGAGSSPLGVNLEQLFVQLNYARDMGNGLTLGGGPVFALQRFSATGLEAFTAMSVNPAAVTGNGDDWSSGVGINLGMLYQASPQLTFGASYRSKINMKKFDQYAGLFAGGGDFDIPSTATLGFAFKPQAEGKLTLTAEYQRIFYSDVPAIANSGAMLATPLGAANGPGFGWGDMDVLRVGASYQANDKLTLRGGISHNSAFIADDEVLLNVLAPATPTWHVSMGMSYKMNERTTFTASYTHAFGPSKDGANLTPGFGQPVSLKMYQNELAAGITWSF